MESSAIQCRYDTVWPVGSNSIRYQRFPRYLCWLHRFHISIVLSSTDPHWNQLIQVADQYRISPQWRRNPRCNDGGILITLTMKDISIQRSMIMAGWNGSQNRTWSKHATSWTKRDNKFGEFLPSDHSRNGSNKGGNTAGIVGRNHYRHRHASTFTSLIWRSKWFSSFPAFIC